MISVEPLQRALRNAIGCDEPAGATPQGLHAARSQQWVKCLAAELRRMFSGDDIVAFCRSDSSNKRDFLLNELLYDVCICRTASCASARRAKQIRYVTAALWHVESEFAANSAEAIKDFNKLVIGSAENKLFVGPGLAGREEAQYLAALLPVARCCSGNLFVALATHPRQWGSPDATVRLWRLVDEQWSVSR